MRPLAEIQAAHDRLLAIILGEIPNPFRDGEHGRERMIAMMKQATGVLCWVLNHDHDGSFAQNLEWIDEFMESRGMRLGPVSEE